MSEHAFGRLHPVSNFLFFVFAVLLGMFFVNLAFLSVSAFFSLAYFFTLRGAKGIKNAVGIALAACIIAFISPLFSTYGDSVLFTYFGGRPYTLEALQYGVSTSGMLFTIALWFACYNRIMTSEKLIYLFEGLAPALSLVFTMVLRLVPALEKKCAAVLTARAVLGKSMQNGTKRERIGFGAAVLSVLISMSLENAIITADSMRCRGYGTGRRTSFAQYAVRRKDWLFAIFTLACALTGAYAAVCGQNGILLGAAAYTAFLSQPLLHHFWEEIKWHILRLKI